MFKRKLSVFILIISLLASIGVPVHGEEVFQDIAGHIYKEQITQLYQEGIVKGVGNRYFKPDQMLSNAQALQLYVNVFNLNIERFRFIKQPLASDYINKADNNAWYADAIIKAGANGVEVDRELIPSQAISRESFYQLLITQMETQYALPLIKLIPVTIVDEVDMNINAQASIQRGISYGILALDKDGRFNPNANISRGEAASVIALMFDYLKAHNYIRNEENTFQSLLNSEIDGDNINFLFDIYNRTERDQIITFSSSQTFDFNVYNSEDEQVYNWSSVRSFMMMLQEVNIEKDSYVRYETPWDYKDASGEKLPNGSYKVVFESHFMFGDEPIDLRSEVMVDIK